MVDNTNSKPSLFKEITALGGLVKPTIKIMNEKLIQSKIDELRIVLEQELPYTVVSFEVIFTGTGTRQLIEHKRPEQLKRQSISVRNIKGEFIR